MIAPHDPDSGWDYIILAGVRSPGVCRLSGHKRPVGWDVKNASGQQGATTKRKGEPIGKFSAEFYLVEDAEFAAWDAFQALIESSVNGADPVALEVVHPDLQRNHFTAVTLEAMGTMDADPMGGARVVVDFIEYRPPKPKATGKPTGARDNLTAGDYKIAAAEAELAGLVAQGNAL